MITDNHYKYFTSKQINDIKSNSDNNYFSPVWDEIMNDITFDCLLDVGC